jgi:hypothetical protein
MVLVFPDSTADLTPWNHWRMPVIVKEVGAELLEGPVLVTIEYAVVSGQEAEFIEAIRKYARTRRRDGAYQWGTIAIPKQPIGLLRSFRCIRGRNICVNTSGKQKRIVTWSNWSTTSPVSQKCDIFSTRIPPKLARPRYNKTTQGLSILSKPAPKEPRVPSEGERISDAPAPSSHCREKAEAAEIDFTPAIPNLY